MRYLIFLVFAFFSLDALASFEYKIESGGKVYTASSAAAVCNKFTSDSQYTKYHSNTEVLCVFTDGVNPRQYTRPISKTEQKCEAGKNVYMDGYITKSDGFPPDSVCSNGCKYTKESDGLAFDTPNGNLNWGFDAKNTGEKCDVETPKGEDTPNKPKMDECKNEKGSDAYCAKDPNKECPDNYKEQMFNDEKLCVKNGDPNDPSSSQPTDPNDPSSSQPTDPNDPSSSQPGTGGGTDLSGVISAIKSVGNAITNAINSLSKTLTDAINKNGKNTVDAIDKNTEETKKTNTLLEDIKDFFSTDNNDYTNENAVISDIAVSDYEKNYVTWGSQCPVDEHVPIRLMGQSSTLTLSWQPICTLLSKIRWAIIACAYFSGAYIILGMRG